MARIENTVFISYRRTDVYTALAVYENLKNQGYDVFFDYRSISSGDFEQIITSNIRARAHFLLILTPTALDRLNEPGDWLRREIETAIDEKRNIVPMFFKGFRFGTPALSDTLTGKLRNLSRYNGLNVHEDYFDEAMHRLRNEYLNKPLETVLHPVSNTVQKIVKAEQIAADKALEQIENVQELVKKGEEKPLLSKVEDGIEKPVAKPKPAVEKKHTRFLKSLLLLGGIIGGLSLISLCIWSGAALLNNFSYFFPAATLTSQPTQPFASSSETSLPSTPELGIGSTITGVDGMTLLYVPAGEFTMGSDAYDNEKPIHTVTLDAFWIDQTEVTNKMYSHCVEAGVCAEPASTSSETHSSYYGNAKFDNYPVIYVDWNMAKTYCEWVDRRLPTEAEWEKAARGTDGRTYPWGNDEPNENSLTFGYALDTTEVGKYPDGASPYGALDMAGNVWEWVNDWYDANYYASSPSSNPQGPATGQYKVLRGGGWDFLALSSSYRFGLFEPTTTYYEIGSVLGSPGFRCAASADEQTSATTFNIGSTMMGEDSMTLLYVPAGEFTMSGGDNIQEVYLDAFWIDKTEVTNQMYSLCVSADACQPPKDTQSEYRSSYYGNSKYENNPVIFVDWTMAKTYCEWADRRLPTDAEWEKAARGNNGGIYPWGNEFDSSLLNFCDKNCLSDWADKNVDDGYADTAPVGSYPNGISPYGALDMAGNVWEWVADWYDETYYDNLPTSNPLGSESGQLRVIRGGGLNDDEFIVRADVRGSTDPANASPDGGFRCAMDATP